MKVDIYRNLHKKCWSIRSREPSRKYGLVVAHATRIGLEDAKFVVSQAGRNRVLKDKRKNVHAVVRGNLIYSNYRDFTDRDMWFKYQARIENNTVYSITYQPYKKSTFFWTDTEHPIYYSTMVIFNEDMKVYASIIENRSQLRNLRSIQTALMIKKQGELTRVNA